MSKQIDEKVVSMQFDNRQFERNVSTSISTLDKLKQSLNLSGASKGLEEVQSASDKVNFSGMSAGIDALQVKFSTVQMLIVQQIGKIVDSAVSAGKRMASALTIDPIKTGFSEYETQIGAVQTILANTESKGTTLQDVNSALDTLNTYADKTIYNFTEMTRNIGTFTAAGIELDKSVSSIQGIANLAAVSGSTSQQASTAMYQLSQALSSGTVKLMDWNSVVNAGMGGQVFQDALKRTATVMGTNVDAIIEKHGSFRESLSEGWITAEVLTKTLEQFTMSAEEGSEAWNSYKKSLMDSGYTEEQALSILKMANTATDAATKVKTFTQLWDTLKESAQSGWTQTWEIIVGDFGEAKEFLTDISNTIGGMIGSAADARNKLLQGGLASGWKQLLGAGIADEAGFQESIKLVTKGYGVAFDEMIAKAEEAGGTFEDALVEGLKSGQITSKMLTGSVEALTIAMTSMSAEELEVAGYTAENVEQIRQLTDALKKGEISMDEFVKKMTRPSGRENLIQSLWNSFNALMSVVKPIKEAFREIFPRTTAEQIYKLTENLKNFTAKLTLSEETSDKVKRSFKGLFATFDIAKQLIVATLQAISPLFKGLKVLAGGVLNTSASLGDWLVSLNETIKKGGVFTKVADKIRMGLEKVGGFLKNVIDGFKEFASTMSNTVGIVADKTVERFGPLSTLGTIIKGIFVGLGKIMGKVMPIALKLATGVGNAIKSLMDEIGNAIQNADYDAIFDMINGGIISAIGVFIARFIKKGGDLVDNVGGIFDGLKGLFDGLSDAMGAFTESIKAETLKKIAISIGILSASLFVLSLIDSEKLSVSLMAITALFGELLGSMSIMSKITSKKGAGKIATSLIAIATAMLILSFAMKTLGKMSYEEMEVALISMTVGIVALVAAINMLPEGNVKKAAKAIRTLSVALLIFAVAMKIMGSLSWGEMARGLTGTVVGLAALVAAVKILPKDTALRAAGIASLAVAMVILGAALKIMASMSWDELARGLTALVVSLGALVAAMKLAKNAIPGALAMAIIAPALLLLAGTLKIMATMSWDEVARGLVVLGGALLIISAALLIMKKAIVGAAALLIVSAALLVLAPALKMLGNMSWEEIARGLAALAGAFIILGVAGLLLGSLAPTLLKIAGAVAIFGLGIAALGVGIVLISVGISALGLALTTFGGSIVVFITSLIGLIPYIIEQVGKGIILLCDVIAGGVDSICAAISAIIQAVLRALIECIPLLLECIGTLLDALFPFLLEYIPKIVDFIFKLLMAVFEVLAEHLDEFVVAGTEIVISLIRGIADAIPMLVDEGMKATAKLLNGIANAIRDNNDDLIAAVDNIMFAIVEAIGAWFGSMRGKGLELLDHFITGVTGKESNLKETVDDLMTKAKQAVVNKLKEWKTAGKDLIAGFIQGIKDKATAVIEAAKGVVSDALAGAKKLLGINSPSREFAEIGRYSDEGIVMGLKKYSGKVTGAAEDVGSGALDSMASAMSGISDLFNNDIESQPTIRPIVDLSEVESGAGAINGMFGMTPSVGVMSNLGAISSMMNSGQNGTNDDLISAINDLGSKLGNGGNNTYNINGITYDDGSNVSTAVESLIRAARMERRA